MTEEKGECSKTNQSGVQEGTIPCEFLSARVHGKVLVTARGAGGGGEQKQEMCEIYERP